ncbi:MAG: hypothetical protein AB7N71_04300, partial [Phycisphaerae bacterium]
MTRRGGIRTVRISDAGRTALPRSLPILLAAIGLAICVGGCQGAGDKRDANAINPDKIETRDDIVQVITYWPKPPWLRDANQAPIGIRPTVFLASGETEK